MHPAEFAGWWHDAVPQLGAVRAIAFAATDNRDRFTFSKLYLPAITFSATQMSANPSHGTIFDHHASLATVRSFHRGGGKPAKAIFGRSNAQPSVFGLDVDLQFLSVPQRIGAIIFGSWAATSVSFLVGDKNRVRFTAQAFIGKGIGRQPAGRQGGQKEGSGQSKRKSSRIDHVSELGQARERASHVSNQK